MTDSVCFKKFIAHRSVYSVTVYIHPYRKRGIYDVKFTTVLEERNFNIINNFSLAKPQHNNMLY